MFDQYTSVDIVSAMRDANGDRHYNEVAQKQTILLVRTGHEDKLSAPINFYSLKRHELPLERNEDLGGINII